MKNKYGFLLFTITLMFCSLPLQGADWATFDSFYSGSTGIGFWGWAGIIAGTVAVGALTFFTFGGGSVAIPGWMATVGGWIGSTATAGLTGAAATSHGLALLGGGAIATGGFGMAGGAAVLTAVLSLGGDVAVTYGSNIALEKWSYSKFVDANKEMLTLPVPRSEKGGKAYKAAMEYLQKNLKTDKPITDPDNQDVLMTAMGTLKGMMSSEKDKEYKLKNDVLLALFQLQTNDYLSAWATSLNAMSEAEAIKEKATLPSFICGLAALSNPNRTLDDGIMYNIRQAFVQEPKNKLIPLMTGCCMDRIMYRYHYGMIDSGHLIYFLNTFTDAKINKEMAAQSLTIFVTRCLIELKRTQQDLRIVSQDKTMMDDKDVVEELQKRYDRHVKLISMMQQGVYSEITRLSKYFPEDSELTAGKFSSLVDSYWRDLDNLKKQITPGSNIPQYTQNNSGRNSQSYSNSFGQNMYGQPYMQNYPNYMQPQFQFNMGNGYNAARNEAAALTRAATQGNVEAMLNLGYCYYYGQGVAQSYSNAITCWTQAAQRGNTEAQYILGKCYYNGDAVSPNYTEAARYFQMAANQGHTEAQSALGVCYYYGQGVTRNMYEARRWLSMAANKGDAIARQYLNSIR